MFRTVQHGSLAVVTDTADRRAIQAELRRLDPDLLLDPECDGQRVFWTVKLRTHDRRRPVRLLVDWRETDGTAKPLCHLIVDEVKKLERRTDTHLVDRVEQANVERGRRILADSEYGYDEAARDIVPRMSPAHSAGFHRGVHLRRSRERARERGEIR